jgi:hypothetical protein
MTRAEFEAHLRVCFQHDNVRARERGHDAPANGLTADQEREIAERVERNYPTPTQCPGCAAWDSGMAAPAQSGEPVAKIIAVDEYGPRIEWTTHWVELIGAKLYAAAQPASGDKL